MTLTQFIVLSAGMLLALVLGHAGRVFWKPRSAEDVERDLLCEALLKDAEHTAQAEFHKSQADTYRKRAARLQAKGVTVSKPLPTPHPRIGRLVKTGPGYNPPPAYGRPPMPPAPPTPLGQDVIDTALSRAKAILRDKDGVVPSTLDQNLIAGHRQYAGVGGDNL